MEAIGQTVILGWNPMPTVERLALPAPLPRLRVAFAADFHIRERTPDGYVREVCALLGGLGADILLLGGDYGESESAAGRLFGALGQYRFPYGAYAVAGNNDAECFGDMDRFRAFSGIPVLVNEAARVEIGDKILEIGGVDEMKHGNPNARGLFSQSADYRILLSHYPVVPDFGNGGGADLVLSGHTHGGQMNFFGFTSYSLGFERGKAAHLSGLREYGKVKLLVSTGIGMSKLPLRVGATPRIHLISLG